MSIDPAKIIWRKQRLRADQGDSSPEPPPPAPDGSAGWISPALAVLAALFFIVLRGGSLDVGPVEARAGIASAGPIGPLGQVYGSWDPQLFPGKVIPARVWTFLAGEQSPTTASLRWPAVITASVLGLILAAQAGRVLGRRAGLFVALTCLGSLLFLDRSTLGLGLLDAWLGTAFYRITGSSFFLLKPITPEADLLAGLGVTACLLRVLSGRADRWAGCWAALGFLSGGWPSLAAIAIPVFALRRFSGEEGKWNWLWPALLALAAWSAWCWIGARPEAWFAAMLRPLTRPIALTLPLWAIAFSLPFGPLSALTISPRIRAAWSRPGRVWISRWAQAIGVLALAGTILPGLGDACRIPIVAGLTLLAGAALDSLSGAWESVGGPARRWFQILAAIPLVPSVAFGIPMAVYLAAAVPYYRPVSLALIITLLGTGLAWVIGLRLSVRRLALGSLVGLAVAWKLAHAGIHVPEWNYRASQGPWGRAIGQWIPRASTLYFINPSAFSPGTPPRDRWPTDLAFYTGRTVRQVASPTALDLEPGPGPHFVLLHPTEFEHWPKAAPNLIKVRELQDAFGLPRILARTEGVLYSDRRSSLGE